MNPNNTIDTLEWLTTGQAARLMRIAPGTLQNWRTQGKGPPFIKRGNNVYYTKTNIELFLDSFCGVYKSTTEWKRDK